MVSVIVVVVDAAASVRVAPATPVPDVTVVIVCAAPNPLSPLNVNGPTAPFEILVNVTVGKRVLVNVQAIFEPGAVAAALSTRSPVAKLGVAVPPTPIPVQVAEANA
jgi:hypothetical protein